MKKNRLKQLGEQPVLRMLERQVLHANKSIVEVKMSLPLFNYQGGRG